MMNRSCGKGNHNRPRRRPQRCNEDSHALVIVMLWFIVLPSLSAPRSPCRLPVSDSRSRSSHPIAGL